MKTVVEPQGYLGVLDIPVVQGDPKRCVPMKISIVTLIKKLFISN